MRCENGAYKPFALFALSLVQELFLCFWSPCSTQYKCQGTENYVENVSLLSFYDKLPHWRNTANVVFFFSFLIGFLHNFTNKMNVGV